MAKHLFRILLILLLVPLLTDAQGWKRDRREFCFMTGGTGFMGELGGAAGAGKSFSPRDFDSQEIQPVMGIGYLYKTSDVTRIKTSVYFGMISGDDAETENEVRQNRNLHFRSLIAEISSQFELTVFSKRKGGHRYKFRGIRGRSHMDYTVYVFAGVGGFYFNPMAQDRVNPADETWHSLRKMGTEGQGQLPTRPKYSNFNVCIPFGGGLKYSIGRHFFIGLEYGYRKTFTDYIDDVSKTYYIRDVIEATNGTVAMHLADPSYAYNSGDTDHNLYRASGAGEQRGDPRDKDTYMFATITVYYKLKRASFAIPKF